MIVCLQNSEYYEPDEPDDSSEVGGADGYRCDYTVPASGPQYRYTDDMFNLEPQSLPHCHYQDPYRTLDVSATIDKCSF